MQVSFTGTFGFNLSAQPTKISKAQVLNLKSIVGQHGGFAPKTGGLTKHKNNDYYDFGISVREKMDEKITELLKQNGITVFDFVKINNVAKNNITQALKYKGKYAKFNPETIAAKLAERLKPQQEKDMQEAQEQMRIHNVENYDDIDVHVPLIK